MPVLSINMLGRITITYKGESIESKMSTKSIALICYLISNIGKKISRERLADYLWADSDGESSRYNLRHCLWSIKRIIQHNELGEDFIVCEKEFCSINKRYDFFCDILFLKESEDRIDLSLDQLLQWKSYYAGEFLEGLYVNKAPDFNDFVLSERIIFQNKNVELLKRILNAYQLLEKSAECIGILKEMLAIDQYNEDFAYMLMDAYCVSAGQNGAIAYYQGFEKNLRKNLNVSPSKTLRAFYEKLISGKQDVSELTRPLQSDMTKQHVKIETFCLHRVPFFWVSDVVGKITEEIRSPKALSLERNCIRDIAYIQNRILLFSDENTQIYEFVPPVRIVHAFREFLICVSELYRISIKINNVDNMDVLSQNALQYIEDSIIEGLEIEK